MNAKAGLLTIIVVLVMGYMVIAQEPAKTPSLPQPNAEQKARLADLAKAWDKESREAEIAKDKYLIALISTLAELGLKPSETAVSWNAKGEPVFARAEKAQATPPPTKPKE